MANGMNKVFLLGNLGAEPELRYTQGGQPVLSLRVATSESYQGKDGQRVERTDWHSVTVWGKRGEALSKLLRKGSGLFVEGSLRTSSYEGKDGTKRYKTEVNAKEVILTCSHDRQAQQQPRPAQADAADVFDEEAEDGSCPF